MREDINKVCDRLVYATNQITLNNSYGILSKQAANAYKVQERSGMKFIGELPEHWKKLTGARIATLDANKIILAHPERVPLIYDIQEQTYKEIAIQA